MIRDFCTAMEQCTGGWSFSVYAGGPDPANGGAIQTIAIHTGCDSYDQTFAKAIPNHKDTILFPYSTFLHSVYRELSPFFWSII